MTPERIEELLDKAKEFTSDCQLTGLARLLINPQGLIIGKLLERIEALEQAKAIQEESIQELTWKLEEAEANIRSLNKDRY